MQIGELKKRIEVHEKHEVRDEYGAVKYEWITVGRVWAKIEPKLGDERFERDRVKDYSKWIITVRFYAGLTTEYRVKHKDTLYDIVSVINKEEGNRWSVMECEKI